MQQRSVILRIMTVHLMLTLMLVAFFAAAPAQAEWFADLYGGGGFFNSDDITIERDTADAGISVSSLDATLHDVDLDDRFSGGLRLGYWFDTRRLMAGFELGLGLDMFYFPLRVSKQTTRASANADIDISISGERITIDAGDDQEVEIPEIDAASAVLAPELMLRYGFFANDRFPHGQVQPYLTIGPAILFTTDEPTATVGLKAGAGLSWQFWRPLALLVEYRFTHFEFETNDGNLVVENVAIRNPEIETTIDAHFIVAGLSLRF